MHHVSSSNMLAIIQQYGSYKDNTLQFLLLILLKVCLDFGVMVMCFIKPLVSFLDLCSISIIIVDLILVIFMSATFWLDVQMHVTAQCFIMANFSAAYAALPAPLLCLSILDNYLLGTRKSIRLVRNIAFILLVWTLAGVYTHFTVDATLRIQENETRYLVCEIQESRVVAYSGVMLFMLLVIVLLPYLQSLPRWIKEADRISKAQKEITGTAAKTSDQMTTIVTVEGECKCSKREIMLHPSLYISFILGFGEVWMPYLFVTTLCVVLEFGVPAYISVNLLWVQCVNSLLTGTGFWLRSNAALPYGDLPDNVCSWQVYWHLGKGMDVRQSWRGLHANLQSSHDLISQTTEVSLKSNNISI